MTNILANVSVHQLQQAIVIREKIDALQSELDQIMGASAPAPSGRGTKRHVSASARAKMAKAQRARWARVKGNGEEKSSKPRRKMSAAAKARLSAAAKRRWKAAKAAGKTRL